MVGADWVKVYRDVDPAAAWRGRYDSEEGCLAMLKEAGGIVRSHQSASVGQVVHALAERVSAGELAAGADEEGLALLMAQVDEVWPRLEFRTPWSRAREHERIRAALARFLRWHQDNRRRLVGVESRFTTEVDLPDGERVRLVGYADRVELDHDDRVVVVDLKTGRSAPSAKSVQQHLQLGLYQYAVDRGALDEVVSPLTGGPGTAGGAELVQLGLEDGSDTASVQPQDVQPEDGQARGELRRRLQQAAVMLRQESFPAIAGQHCRDCPFVPLCPIKSAGPVVAQ